MITITVLIWLGQEFSITKLPDVAPSLITPSSSYSDGMTPKKGRVAEPGFVGVTQILEILVQSPFQSATIINDFTLFLCLQFIIPSMPQGLVTLSVPNNLK